MFDKNTILNPHQSFVFEVGCYYSHRNTDNEVVDTSMDFINTIGNTMEVKLLEFNDPQQQMVSTRLYVQYMAKAVFTAYLALRTVRYCQKGPTLVRNKAKSEYIRFIETLERDLRSINPGEIAESAIGTLITDLTNTREMMMFFLLPIVEAYAIIALIDHTDIRDFMHKHVKDGTIFGNSYGAAIKSWLMRDLNWKKKYVEFNKEVLNKHTGVMPVSFLTVDEYFNKVCENYLSAK